MIKVFLIEYRRRDLETEFSYEVWWESPAEMKYPFTPDIMIEVLNKEKVMLEKEVQNFAGITRITEITSRATD